VSDLDDLDTLAAMVAEADRLAGDEDFEEEPDREDGADDYFQPLDAHALDYAAGRGGWAWDEDFEESGPADRWGEEGPFGHEDDEDPARWDPEIMS
jgi:hypothetical protein